MIAPLDVPLELVGPEVDGPQIAGGVALGLVVEVRRVGIAALAAGGDGAGADFWPNSTTATKLLPLVP